MTTEDRLEIPLSLRTALESGNCVLFIGAGIGLHAKRPDGSQAPDGATLARNLAAKFGIDFEEPPDLAKIAQVAEIREGRQALLAQVAKELVGLEPDETLRTLFSMRWKAIFTTNYDRVIERSYELIEKPLQQPISISLSSEVRSIDFRYEVPVYHVHGSVFNGLGPIVITSDDYARFREHRQMLFEILKHECATSNVLFLGYSHQDSNWNLVQMELRQEFLPSSPPISFRVARSTPALDREVLESQGLTTIDSTLKTFAEAVRSEVAPLQKDPSSFEELAGGIPAELKSAFSENPAAVLRMLNSWEYVNQSDFAQGPNIHEFLSGDQPNWGLIASGLQFERDIGEPIVEELLDFATDPEPRPRALLITGPAGYGITTVLMSAAARLVRERAGSVLMLRTGRTVIEGDIQLASALLDGPRFFFVDNASESSATLVAAIQWLRESGTAGCLVLGERTNEWRQRKPRLFPHEFVIEPLSELEIDRLLECLDKNHALGKLADLDLDLRRAAIREKHQKELLVAMKETTEGKQFDAIVEDEYRGIGDELARRAYAITCGLSRLRAYARDWLLSEILGVGITDIYDRTRDAAEGVIVFDCVDEGQQSYAARARHHLIAELVWDRCVSESDREVILHKTIGSLNLKYPVDRQAFDQLIRSDDTLVNISSFEAKTRFFELASRKDPTNAYVRQHYARLLRSEEKLELALAEINAAIEMAPTIRVLYHTKGTILADMAISHVSVEVGRRLLAQSESSFRAALQIHPRDEYAYHGLASLFFNWAQHAPSDEEAVDYLSRAEEIVNVGLKQVRDREALWVISAQIHAFLGERPAAKALLEKALEENPNSVVARYLLGRSLKKSGDQQKAIEVLRPGVEMYPEEFRLTVIYAQALHELGEPYEKTIAILQLSKTHGMRDPRFIATFGGMLFMSGKYSEAGEVFQEWRRRDFSWEQLTRPEFVPQDPETHDRITLQGQVASTHAGYSFIQPDEYPAFFCPRSKYGKLLLRPGLLVKFEVAFTARGAIVQNLNEA